jgi:uncharacterized protein (DUF58 family)
VTTVASSERRQPVGTPAGGRRALAAGSSVLGQIERRVGVTPAGLAVLALSVAGIVLGRRTANSAVVLFAYGLLILLALSWLLGRRPLPLSAQRSQLPGRLRVGQQIEVQLELSATRRVSTVILEDQLHEQLGRSSRLPVSHLVRDQSASFGYTFIPQARGVYDVGALVAESGDPFGLTKRRQVIADPVQVIVHPPVERLVDRITSRAWEDPPIRPPISKPWPTGFEFYGMRDYEHGDDPRRIVWRAVAAHGKYLVRESEQGITDRVFLLLDTDVESHSPGTSSDTFETAISVAASLAVRHLDDGMSVSLERNSSCLADSVRGKTRAIPLLDALASLRVETCPLDVCLDRMLVGSHAMQHVVVTTPRLTPAGAARLRLMIDRGVSLLLVLVLWDDTEPATLHRAGMLGCNVVEVHAGAPLGRVFSRVVGTGRR